MWGQECAPPDRVRQCPENPRHHHSPQRLIAGPMDVSGIVCFTVAACCGCLVVASLCLRRQLRKPVAASPTMILVTAHPDDEAMFFIPAIQSFQQRGYTVYAICLSTGEARLPYVCKSSRAPTVTLTDASIIRPSLCYRLTASACLWQATMTGWADAEHPSILSVALACWAYPRNTAR